MTEPAKQIVASRPLREQVADIIRGMILRGELGPGEQLSERAIGQMLQVSTTPVKEALRTLQAEGLIYTKPRSGSYVADISIDDMLKIAFMRSSLEGVAAYYASAALTEAQLDQMRQLLDAVAPLLPDYRTHQEEIHQHNVAFHNVIRQAAGNSYLTNQIETLRTIDYSFRRIAQISYIEEPLPAHREHREILSALEGRQADRSEALMVAHIRRVAVYVADCAKALRAKKALDKSGGT